MSLLRPSDITNILGAIKLVTDQFFVTPVTYKLGIDSTDRWQEDRKDKLYTIFNLMALKESQEGLPSISEKTAQGDSNNNRITLTFNLEDLIAVGGIVDSTTKEVIFNQNKDYVIVHNVTYKVDSVKYDGPLTAQNVLVIVEGYTTEKYT